MAIRLLALRGPLRGQSFPLPPAGEVVIGRESRLQVSVPDRAVSRRHCSITHTDEAGWLLTDLGSRHGTRVNDKVVGERSLHDGDRIAVGDTLFVFRAGDDTLDDQLAGSFSDAIQIVDSEFGAETTIELHPDSALYLSSARVSAELRSDDRVARDLSALLAISTAIASIADPSALQKRLLESCLTVVPARRATLLLVGRDRQEVRSSLTLAPGCDEADLVCSRTIVKRVLAAGVAILSSDVATDGVLSAVESVMTSGARSVLCVPLATLEHSLGVLYLDADERGARFDARHLELVTAIATIAAVALENAERLAWAETEVARLRSDIDLAHDMVGSSPQLGKVLALIAKVAPHDTTVLIRGESGTGKEPAARAIHRNSGRADRSFIAINCAAVPDNLLESELFGHEKGAFTGATERKVGKMELADGGTLFLDEVGELPAPLQAKLLRVLQERELERVGGTRAIKVDVRVIAATNRDLEAAMRDGGFREDLFYRLNVVTLTMPPLRERGGDILALARHFATRAGTSVGRVIKGIAPRAAACLSAHRWPGNVRELQNAIERAVVLGNGPTIELEDLPESIVEPAIRHTTDVGEYHAAVTEAKREVIKVAYDRAGGNITETARLLGLHPNYLHRLLKSLDLRAELERG